MSFNFNEYDCGGLDLDDVQMEEEFDFDVFTSLPPSAPPSPVIMPVGNFDGFNYTPSSFSSGFTSTVGNGFNGTLSSVSSSALPSPWNMNAGNFDGFIRTPSSVSVSTTADARSMTTVGDDFASLSPSGTGLDLFEVTHDQGSQFFGGPGAGTAVYNCQIIPGDFGPGNNEELAHPYYVGIAGQAGGTKLGENNVVQIMNAGFGPEGNDEELHHHHQLFSSVGQGQGNFPLSSSPSSHEDSGSTVANNACGNEKGLIKMKTIPQESKKRGAKPKEKSPRTILYKLEITEEMDEELKKRVRRSKKCKQFRDGRKMRMICEGCFQACGGNMERFERMHKFFTQHPEVFNQLR